ncbi:SPOR domain-containing protein [Actibacterium sp.]|uniref:SPOR domain-containing protein n=1 Tax=Actibacterium sp. TaxID=1872125 RepID=UPI0035628847
MKIKVIGRTATALCVILTIAGCTEGSDFSLFPPKADSSAVTPSTTTRIVERDVEAPEVFQTVEAGLWDGRPSLGGVWVAYPGVTEPERVIIRNETNGKFVIGALFNRERDNPGPRLQVSSDAASALGMLAGQPTKLSVTVLRREEVPVAPPAPAAEPTTPAKPTDTESEIKSQELAPLAAAAAAIDAAEKKSAAQTPPPPNPVGDITPAAAAPAPADVTKPAATKPAAAPAPKTSGLEKPYIQIGIFSVEANANNTAIALRTGGIVPTVLKQESQGKAFWRVVVGPATSASERSDLLNKIKDLGFADAYFVTN